MNFAGHHRNGKQRTPQAPTPVRKPGMRHYVILVTAHCPEQVTSPHSVTEDQEHGSLICPERVLEIFEEQQQTVTYSFSKTLEIRL